jgi:peptidoglycan/xylan/chitin deacetylase (PgdA/CDA1 family)
VKKGIKNLIYFLGSKKYIGSLISPFQGKGAILCYHRVVDQNTFDKELSPQKNLLISTNDFDNQIHYLSKFFSIISIDDMSNHIKSKSKEFKVSITFDDGYKDNLDNALPILEQYNIPATIYVTTRFPEGDCRMWWYEIWEIIQSLDVVLFSWKNQKFNLKLNSYSKKIYAYNLLCNLVAKQNYEDQNKIILLIGGVDYKQKNYSGLCLSWDEIKKLSKNRLITIGSHSHTHSSLSHLDDEKVKSELIQSKKLIEKNINNSVHHLAYPFGTQTDVSEREFQYANDVGHYSAVVTRPNKINDSTDLFSIPRISAGNIDLNTLKAKVSGIDNLIYLFRS